MTRTQNCPAPLGAATGGGLYLAYPVQVTTLAAMAVGVVMAAWPTKVVKARVVVLGPDSTSMKQ